MSDVAKLVGEAKQLVRRQDGRIRVEDLLSSLAAVAGEMVLRRTQIIDLSDETLNPGSPVFSPDINKLLSGDRSLWPEVPITSTFGGLYNVLTRANEIRWPPETFPDIAQVYQLFARERAKGVPRDRWGWAPLSVPPDNRPTILPLRAAYNLRQSLLAMTMSKSNHLQISAELSFASVLMALLEVRKFIDQALALRLVFETLNAMAKTIPILPRHMAEVAREKSLPDIQPDRWL
jgi:hypothetical protein